MHTAPAPMTSSSSNGAPVDASEVTPDDVAVSVAAAGGGLVEARVSGTDVGEDVETPVAGGDPDTVGCGHEASVPPPRAASIPQTVTGTVTPVPGVPGVPIGMEVEPVPVHVPPELPSSAAVMAQTVTGVLTGPSP